MELRHIELKDLHISPLNMRHGKKDPDISDILPSIKARGILQPLLVRPNEQGFEIVAGRRRYFSAKAIEQERGSFDPVPCGVMAEGDDAAALEASLIENTARLDADEITQFETFAKLILQGKMVEQIAATFGLTERQVEQRLAIGNLAPRIRDLYRKEEIESDTLQFLTMATARQQREWLKLYDSSNAPDGYHLKHWLCGGHSISTKVALFPPEWTDSGTVHDLFGDESYFVKAEEFWSFQDQAVSERRDDFLKKGWADVTVLERGKHFDQWAFEKAAKKDGGKVYIAVMHSGEVEVFQGWLPRKQAKAAQSADKHCKKAEAPPAMTQAMQNYLELHRHAATRLALMEDHGKAFRLLVAHAVASSGNWQVREEAQRSASNAIKASIEGCAAQKAFETQRTKIEELLDLPANVAHDERTALCFAKLLSMKDTQVMRVAAYAMAESLAAGSLVAELAGSVLEVDSSAHWKADDCFLDMIRDKATLCAMLAEVAGKDVAKANEGGKAAVMRQIIRDTLAGSNGRKKAESWLPGWMAFPFRAYGKGSSSLAENAATVKKLMSKL